MGMRKSHDESVYHKPLFHKLRRKALSKNRYFNDKTSNVKCHAGNSGNVNLHFFHCKLYNDFFFFFFVFYHEIISNQGSRLTFCTGCTGAPNFFSEVHRH